MKDYLLNECADCGIQFDYEECWHEDCRRLLHVNCLYMCEWGKCDNFFCKTHTYDHNCEGI